MKRAALLDHRLRKSEKQEQEVRRAALLDHRLKAVGK